MGTTRWTIGVVGALAIASLWGCSMAFTSKAPTGVQDGPGGTAGTTGGTTGTTGNVDVTGTPDTTSAAHWFSSSMFFNQSIRSAAADPQSATLISTLVANGGWGNGGVFQIDFGLDVYYADARAVRLPFQDDGVAKPDSDIPLTVPAPPSGSAGFESAQGRTCDGGDCHYLAVDEANQKLYESFESSISGGAFHSAGSFVIWDFLKVYPANLRGDVCTSADAGGLPIAPLLFTAEEVAAGRIDHAIRLILPNLRIQYRTYVRPATHGTGAATGWATTNGIPYGARFRLRSDYPLSTLSAGAQVVARALQEYGMILADGGQIALTAKSDAYSTTKWTNLLDSHSLSALKPGDFDIVDGGNRIAFTSFDCVRNP